MEKSKCKAKAAALLMALVILFIPFGSAFATGRPYVSNLRVDDGFEIWYGFAPYRNYRNHTGEFYVRQGYANAFLEGEFVNVGSSFTLDLVVRDYDNDRYIRKVSSKVDIPSSWGTPEIEHLCNVGNRDRGSAFCSKEMTKALDLRGLPPGNYGFTFYINESSHTYGTTVYVKVYSAKAEDFVMNASNAFLLKQPVDSYDKDIYKLSTQQISATDYLWNMYYQNQAKGAFKGATSRQAIRTACKAAFGRYPTVSEENSYMKYCSVMGEPLTIKRIIYSATCQNHIIEMGLKR